MEALVDQGITKSIGVSNFQAQSLYDILTYNKHPISSLQIEHHPYLVQPELIRMAGTHGITVTAYSSFGPQSFLELPADFRDKACISLVYFLLQFLSFGKLYGCFWWFSDKRLNWHSLHLNRPPKSISSSTLNLSRRLRRNTTRHRLKSSSDGLHKGLYCTEKPLLPLSFSPSFSSKSKKDKTDPNTTGTSPSSPNRTARSDWHRTWMSLALI